MTTTLSPNVALRPAADADESAVALTLSWPMTRSAAAPAGGVQGGGSHIVELIGDIDVVLALRVDSTLAGIAAESADLTVDVSGVRFIDARGLGLLAMMHQRVTASGGQMSVIGAAPRLRGLLCICRLDHLLSGATACR